MRCIAKVKEGKIKRRCKNQCRFLYCKTHKKKLKRSLTIGGVLSIILIIFSFYTDVFETLRDYFSSPYENYERNEVIKGVLISNKLKDQDQILIRQGTTGLIVKLAEIKEGIDFNPVKAFGCFRESIEDLEDPSRLTLKIENRRIKVTKSFFEILSNQIIGKIVNNKWKIDDDRFFEFYADDKILEVIDNYDNVAFSLEFMEPNIIDIKGYFVGDICVMVITKEGVTIQDKSDPLFQDLIFDAIRKIPRRYKGSE